MSTRVSTPVTPATASILAQAHNPVLTGNYEVYVPAQQGRIYFVDHPRHVFELLELLVGLSFQQHRRRDPQGSNLARQVGGTGLVFTGIRGEAEVYLTRPRTAPLFQVGDQVHFFGLSTAYHVVGIGLYEDCRQIGQTMWAYYYAGAAGAGRPIAESQTTRANAKPVLDANKGPGA